MGVRFQFFLQEADDPAESQLLGARDRRDALKRSDELCEIDQIPRRGISTIPKLVLPGLEDFELLDPLLVRTYDTRSDHDSYIQWEFGSWDRASILRLQLPPRTLQVGQVWTVFLAANCNVPLITTGDRYEGRLGLILTRLPARSDHMYCMMRT